MRLFLIVLATILTCSTAEARRYHPQTNTPPQLAFNFFQPAPQPSNRGYTRYVSHPAGCPRRNFCGCGLSVHFFGKPIRALYLSSEWGRRFVSAIAAPGMAAWRHGHVFGLLHHIRGDIWMVYDANSGGHKTRIHPRSIRGYRIVNPRQPR